MPARLGMATRHPRWYPLSRLGRKRTDLLARAYVLADRLKSLQNALPLRPIELPQERPETLNKRVLQDRFPVRFRHKKTVQPDTQGFGNFFERA